MKWKDRRDKLAKRTKTSATERNSSGGNILTYEALGDKEIRWADKLRKGRDENKFDILPFIVSEEWYAEMRTFSGKPTNVEVDDADYKLEFAVHRNIGPEKTRVLCLTKTFGRACPVCEERTRLLDNSDEEDPTGELADALKPTWRTLYNIIDLNGDEEVRLWEYSYYLFERSLLDEVALGADGLQIHWDLEEGQTIVWRGKEKTIGKKGHPFVECDRVDFEEREPYNESILEDVYPLDKMLVIPTYEDVARILTDTPATGDEKKEKEKEKSKDDKSRDRGSRYKKEEPDDGPDDKDDNDDPDGNPPWDKDGQECPEDLTFGADFQQDDKCNDCDDDAYNGCQAESERLAEEKKKKEEEEKKVEKPPRGRNRKKTDEDKPSTSRRRSQRKK